MSHVFHKLCSFRNARRLLLNKKIIAVKRKYVPQHKKNVVSCSSNIIFKDSSTNDVKQIYFNKFSTTSEDDDAIEEMQINDVLADLTTELGEQTDVKYFLYTRHQDQLLEQISNSSSVQELFNIIKDYQDLKHYHVCQSVLTLWDLQRAYSSCYLLNLDKMDISLSLETMLNNYKNEISSHPEFQKLLNYVINHSSSFSPLELSCCLFSLKKIGLKSSHETILHLLNLAYESINNDIDKWCLKSMSLYTSTFEPKDALKSIYLTKDLLPRYLQAIETCENAEDFELITIGLHNIHILISRPVLDHYIEKLKDILSYEAIEQKHLKMLIKAMMFLNLPHWSRDNSAAIEYISSFFKDHIDTLNVPELLILHKTCAIQSSSGYLREPIKNRAMYFLEKSKTDDRITTFMKVPELLLCQVTNSNLVFKNSVEKIIQDCIQHSMPSMLMAIYKLLKHLSYPKPHLSELFWSKLVNLIMTDDIPDYMLLRLCYRYMHFNNHLGNSFRSFTFEKAVINKCLSMSDGLIVHLPRKLSRYLAFLVAYGLDKRHGVDYNIIHNLIVSLDGMKGQFNSLDWLSLARGVYIAKLTKTWQNNHNRNLILMQLDRILNEVTSNYLYSSKKCEIDELCCYMKIFHYNNSRFDSEEFVKLVCKLERSSDALNPRRIREILNNLYVSGATLPKFFNRITDFVIERGDNLFGEIIYKVLHTFYTLGYTPQKAEFFDVAIKIIERDKNILNCLLLLQASMALSFFGHLPESFVKYVFSLEFMERIDEEIDSCYFKLKYPLRIRESLMELNRAVCLELPQYEVPWFHTKYIEGRKALTPFSRSKIYDDVLNTLVQVLGSKNAVRQHHFSPYGYKLDFFAQLDHKNKPVMQTSSTVNNVNKSKIAVALIEPKMLSKYCYVSENPSVPLRIKILPKGHLLSRKRHLELMGFKIIDIHPTLWNSMHMSEPNEKYKFLYKEIFGDAALK